MVQPIFSYQANVPVRNMTSSATGETIPACEPSGPFRNRASFEVLEAAPTSEPEDLVVNRGSLQLSQRVPNEANVPVSQRQNIEMNQPAPELKPYIKTDERGNFYMGQPISAWGPNMSTEQDSRFIAGHLPPNGRRPMKQSKAIAMPLTDTPNATHKDASISELDDLVQRIRQLCLQRAPNDAKKPILEEILPLSNRINEKYAIIDVSDLIKDNKVRISYIISIISIISYLIYHENIIVLRLNFYFIKFCPINAFH